MRDVLVVGHSHLAALTESLGELAYDSLPTALNRYRCIQLHQERYYPAVIAGRLNAALRAEIASASFDVLVSMIAGNEHTIFGLVNHPAKFDFILPERPDLPLQQDAEILPYAAVARQLETRIIEVGLPDLLAALRREFAAPVYHVESPPPVPSEEHIRRYPGVFRDKVDELGVAPASLRYKLWRVYSALVWRICKSNRVAFIEAPAAMRDENDMLRPEAWVSDPSHCSALYGRQVRIAIDERLRVDAAPERIGGTR